MIEYIEFKLGCVNQAQDHNALRIFAEAPHFLDQLSGDHLVSDVAQIRNTAIILLSKCIDGSDSECDTQEKKI